MTISLASITKGCKKFWEKVFAENGLVNNPDGTISVFIKNSNGIVSPMSVSKECCNVLNTIKDGLYYYDLDAQKCRWSDQTTLGCLDEKPFKVVLNPKGNDGSIFYFENDEKCNLVVDFDFLFKFNCETLTETLNKITPIDPQLASDIQILQDLISEQVVKCEEISSNLTYLTEEFNNVGYSIICDHFPMGPIIVDPIITPDTDTGITPTETQKAPFFNTGFGGGLAPFAFPQMLYGTVSFCLTEPSGLNVWENILGANRYQLFLDADPNSYTCDDVLNIFNQNQVLLGLPTPTTPLIVDCDTPFGYKISLKSQIELLVYQQIECNNVLLDLQAQLDVLIQQENSIIGKCKTPIGIMESLDVSMSIELVGDDNTLTAVTTNQFFTAIGDGNLYNYLVSHPTDSGFYICGEPNTNETWTSGCTGLFYPELTSQIQAETYTIGETNVSSCSQIKDYIIQALFDESGLASQINGQTTFNQSLSPTIMSSTWLHNTTIIDDVNVINMIANKKIKLSLNVNSSCGDFCLLIDKISLSKECVSINNTNIFVSDSPGFKLERVIDNKKSWLDNSSLVNRTFDINNAITTESIRKTNYNLLDERLVINSKEIDLDINMAAAVEYDVWYYLLDNPCLLSGVTNCDSCKVCGDKQFQDDDCFVFQDEFAYDFQDSESENSIFSNCCGDNKLDFNELLTTDLSTVKTIEIFENTLISELINVKNRQTISGYPTLKALYERYLKSIEYCDTTSSAFDYYTMDQFAGLIGNYWVDLIEQVIPSTTIWGSVKIYTNTIFDQQKFKYKQYSTLIGENPFNGVSVSSPINNTYGKCQDIEVITTALTIPKEGELMPTPIYNISNILCLAQMNWGSEFIGTVKQINE